MIISLYAIYTGILHTEHGVSMTHHYSIMNLALFVNVGQMWIVFVWLHSFLHQQEYMHHTTSLHLPAHLSSRGAPSHRTLFEQL